MINIMLIESIVASIFIAFGILSIMFSIEHGINDKEMMGIIILGILSILLGGWIFFTFVTIEFIIRKIIGIILAAIGLFLIFGFPDAAEHQREGFSRLGIFIGIILAIFGIWLLIG